MKIVVLSCVHGRLKTVKKALDLSPELERVFVCSTPQEVNWLKSHGYDKSYQFGNFPLNEKWNYGVKLLKDIDFDYVVMMGSDDYFDENFVSWLETRQGYDMIAFTDMYFKDPQGRNWYWKGYETNRVGEPAGAGKTYSKEYLERIDYNLFPVKSNKGLDGQSWVVANFTNANMLVTSLKEEGLFLCDIKDGQGITPLQNIRGLVRC